MKKIVFSLLLLLGCGFQSHAQFNIAVVNPVTTQADTLDYALFRAQYMLSMRIDTVDLEKNPVTEEMMLEVGPSCSVFHSYTKYLQDSVVQADFANGASQEVIMRHMQQYKGGNVTYRLYKNYPTGKTTLLDRIGTSDLRCEEEAEVPAWTLLPETETILGYTCHKASCRFKGRDYEAWYTPEIPRGEGPWKLTGLPGLILRAEDTRDHYRYECTGIEQYTTPHPILYRGKKAEPVSRRQLHRIYERFYADPIGYITQASGGKVSVTVQGENGEKAANPRHVPYNPIELEF